MPRVALIIPASSNSRFYSQIAAFNAAIKALAWTSWEPMIHVSMGERWPLGTPADLFERWRPYLSEVQISYVSETKHNAEGNWAQVDASLLLAPRDADVYATFDADTFPVSNLEDILEKVYRENAIAGVMAHFAPPGIAEIGGWDTLAHLIGQKPLNINQFYSLMPTDAPHKRRASPIYFNGGVVFYSKDSFEAFLNPYFTLRRKIATRFQKAEDFSGQLATAFALNECGKTAYALPMRYNYPNDDRALALQPGELDQVAVFHYLRLNQFDRGEIFASTEGYRDFLEKQLDGVNIAFRQHVIRVLGTCYPFPPIAE